MKVDKDNYDYSHLYQNTQPPKSDNTPGFNSSDLERMLEEQLRSVGRAVDEGMSYGFAQMHKAFHDDERWTRATDRMMFVAERVSDKLEHTKKCSFMLGENNTAKRPVQAEKQCFRKLKSAATKRRILGWVLSVWCGFFAVSFIVPMLVDNAFMGMFAVMAALALWGLDYGVENLRFARFARNLVRVAEGERTLPLDYLADAMQMSKRKLRMLVQRYLNHGWMSAWMDKEKDTLYLDLAEWRAARDAQQAAPEAQEQPEPEKTETKEAQAKAPSAEQESLAKLKNFVEILAKESCMMDDNAQAVQELKELEQTSRAILSWTEKHPESLPKLRHMTEQYIPMTLKLLYTYNDLKLHNGDNAVHVREDIAGMLHSLNLGFSALQDKLLDDVAMDITGDIAALQGMLAWDGLSENDVLQETATQKQSMKDKDRA